jgi:hypothetical protein
MPEVRYSIHEFDARFNPFLGTFTDHDTRLIICDFPISTKSALKVKTVLCWQDCLGVVKVSVGGYSFRRVPVICLWMSDERDLALRDSYVGGRIEESPHWHSAIALQITPMDGH